MKVAFCHPDLGLGGAERLVVDAALELQARHHAVALYTAHHDPARCFSETVDGSLPPVQVHGDWLPRSVFGLGHAVCAYVRCIFLALAMCWASWRQHVRYDVVIVDQVSAVLPVLRLFMPRSKRLFYCHFPDLLLARRGSWAKRAYRAPIDWLEEASLGSADQVLVNSRYTLGIFGDTFRCMDANGVAPAVLHPAVRVPQQEELDDAERSWRTELDGDLVEFLDRPGATTFLSINRFERKKGLRLAIDALAALRAADPVQVAGEEPEKRCSHTQLVMAGGYDSRLAENVEHYEELVAHAASLGLSDRVRFMRSFTDRQKALLLAATAAVVYTPRNEHFGIVPLEGMASGRLVIACDSGGPVESIVDGETGFLCRPDAGAFAVAMGRVAGGGCGGMGRAARERAAGAFSRGAFGDSLNAVVEDMVDDNNYDYVH
eukprot:evm.model.scf_1870.3 EVM.evm.TU.scf_1870.3   scf_1870:26597-28325(-)